MEETTTQEQDRPRAGQRRVNIIWEVTQSIIAMSVITVTLYVDGRVALSTLVRSEVSSSGLMQLNVMAALVTGFYFGRTNHQKVGGIEIGR